MDLERSWIWSPLSFSLSLLPRNCVRERGASLRRERTVPLGFSPGQGRDPNLFPRCSSTVKITVLPELSNTRGRCIGHPLDRPTHRRVHRLKSQLKGRARRKRVSMRATTHTVNTNASKKASRFSGFIQLGASETRQAFTVAARFEI